MQERYLTPLGVVFFDEFKRLSWPYDNPNNLGFLIGLLFVLVATVAAVDHSKTRKATWRQVALAPLAIVLIFALVKTYSRGAIIGTAVALLVGCCLRHIRRPFLFIAFVVLLVTIATPGGARRMNLNTSTDLSIVHRLAHWRECIDVIRDNPWIGVKRREFYKLHDTFYKRLDRPDLYATAVSTPISIALFWGVPAAAVLYGIMLFVVLEASKRAACGEMFATVMLLQQAFIHATSVWSTFIYNPVYWIGLSIGLLFVCAKLVSPIGRIKHLRRFLSVASFSSAVMFLIILLGLFLFVSPHLRVRYADNGFVSLSLSGIKNGCGRVLIVADKRRSQYDVGPLVPGLRGVAIQIDVVLVSGNWSDMQPVDLSSMDAVICSGIGSDYVVNILSRGRYLGSTGEVDLPRIFFIDPPSALAISHMPEYLGKRRVFSTTSVEAGNQIMCEPISLDDLARRSSRVDKSWPRSEVARIVCASCISWMQKASRPQIPSS